MQVGYSLNIEQVQKLVMTPELRQAILVLQLSSLELEQYIEQQLQENPLLEIEDDERKEPAELVDFTQESGGLENTNKRYDLDWQDYFLDCSDIGMPRKEKGNTKRPENYDNLIIESPNLIEHLIRQLHMATSNSQERLIGEYLIGNIDEHGYLQATIKEVADFLGRDPEKVQEVLKVIHLFDPPGIGARTLQECLLIQLNHFGLNDELLIKVIKNHLTDLARGRLGMIAHQLNSDIKEIQRVANVLKTLDPKPGCNYSVGGGVRYVVPDIILQKVGKDYEILINDIVLPRLYINSTYRSILLNKESDPQTRSFVEGKLNLAAWLIKSIEQRRLTLYKVASCLVELQRDFLDHGLKYLKPLNLKQVAKMVDLHESTVSRATSNKYIQTHMGLFEMRCFFSTGLAKDNGKMISAACVKKMLEEIIAAENSNKPLNDSKIAEILHKRGIKISRRTIAKYREELDIPPIRQRIRYLTT